MLSEGAGVAMIVGIVNSSMTKSSEQHSQEREQELESELSALLYNDDVNGLISALVEMKTGNMRAISSSESSFEKVERSIFNYWFPYRLLYIACQIDSVLCTKALLEGKAGKSIYVNVTDESSGKTALHHAAEGHSVKCIQLLLSKHAKTEVKSKEGLIPLEYALQSERIQIHWSCLPCKIEDLVHSLKQQDLQAVKILAENTRDTMEIVCKLANEGKSIPLISLLIATQDFLFTSHQSYVPLVECIVQKILTMHAKQQTQSQYETAETTNNELINKGKDEMLKGLEIILHLKSDECERNCTELETVSMQGGKKFSALLNAAQAGDEALVALLLKTNTNVNETDREGNTALHLCLKTVPDPQVTRIVRDMLRHGASVRIRNRLGLTAVHMAAGQGRIQALEILLVHDPASVHITAETKETALFFAAKSNHIECAQLLLHYGANPHTLSLRRQRPIDVTSSQAMRSLLSLNDGSFIGRVKGDVGNKIQAVTGLAIVNQPNITSFDRYNNKHGVDKSISVADVIKVPALAKTMVCRYYGLPSGCARGQKCLYAHGKEELKPRSKIEASKEGKQPEKVFIKPNNMKQEQLYELVFEKEAKEKSLNVRLPAPPFDALCSSDGIIAAKRDIFPNIITAMAIQERAKEEEEKAAAYRWVSVFKKWLPSFLCETYKRLDRASSFQDYPLSSLKGDFRATCGLEIDHASLGFMKLSEFVRSIPDLCQAKVVFVGEGPATHFVLLPPFKTPDPESRSRSYAAALGHSTAFPYPGAVHMATVLQRRNPESQGIQDEAEEILSLNPWNPNPWEVLAGCEKQMKKAPPKLGRDMVVAVGGEIEKARVTQMKSEYVCNTLFGENAFCAPWFHDASGNFLL